MSVSKSVLKSSSFLMSLKFIQRGIGVISAIILARLLTPEDFGVVAISITLVYFFEAISSLGSEQYIIQKTEVSNETLNTAWTIDILIKLAFFCIFLLCIPYIGEFYNNIDLTAVLYVSSSILIINALKNPGIFLLKKNFEYKSIFRLNVGQKMVSFSVVIIAAYIHPSYWAMVYGDIVSALILAVGSYKIHPFRPRFSIVGFADQWIFSKWIILRGIIGYSRSQFDTFIVSTSFSAQILGGYHMVRQLSVMPSSEIIAPAVEPLLAAFSLTKNDHIRLAYQFRLSFLLISIIALPIAGYLWLFPQPIIDTLLGQKWVSTYEYLSAFAIFFLSIAFIQIPAQVCVAIGRLRSLLIYEVLSLILIVAVLWAVKGFTLYDFILVRGGLGLVTLTGLMIYLNTQIKIQLSYLIYLILPSVVSVIFAGYVTDTFLSIEGINAFITLLYTGSLYSIIYLFVLFTLYLLIYSKTEEWLHLFKLVEEQVLKLAVMLKNRNRNRNRDRIG
jgi:lipopolysaccharide exporter